MTTGVAQATEQSLVTELPAIEPVSVNGLIAGKAVVNVGGRHHVMRVGQQVGNVKLLEADQYSALLSIGAVQKRFYLQEAKLEDYSDDFITRSQDVTYEQADILASNELVRAKSHIINIELLERLDDKARFRVEYFYNASHGKRAYLRARTFAGGQDTGFSAHTHSNIEPGRNLVDIVLMMNEKAPETYTSDAVKFEITGEKNVDGEIQVLSKYSPFQKIWQRPVKSKPKVLLGNATWQTSSQ